jgi:hypothetical protein
VKFENIQSEPNFFTVVGRTHFERWHSAFFGWLLDINGSHLLRDYVFRKFLHLLFDERCVKPSENIINDDLILALPTIEFSGIEVSPNEFFPNETSIKGIGSFDIFLSAVLSDKIGKCDRINVIFELKIDSKIKSEQSNKYASWLINNHPNDINILIYVLPKLLSTSDATVGDNRWYCLDYQLINDQILSPLLDHPNLNEKVKPFIIQYIKNLKIRYRGIKMAITNEEKRLARDLYEKYSDVFDAIYDALQESDILDFSTSEFPERRGRSTGKIAVNIDNKLFVNDSVRTLFKDILSYLVDNDIIRKIPLPWGIGSKRYIVTNEKKPIHPSGREFFVPVKYKGYALETHYARDRSIKVLHDLCRKLEIDFEVVEV